MRSRTLITVHGNELRTTEAHSDEATRRAGREQGAESSLLVSRSPVRLAPLLVGLVAAIFAASPTSASARERTDVAGVGVAGEVVFDDGRFSAGLQGWVKDTSADRACAEVWMDFTTRPHHHFDAFAVRICGSGRSGWGTYNKAGRRWGWTVRGFRTAVCTYRSNGTRKCSRQWVHDSVRARTFKLQEL